MISLLVTNNIEPPVSETAAPPRCKNKTVHHALVGHSNPHHLRPRKRKAPIHTKPPKEPKKLSSFIPSSNPDEQRESVASTIRPLFKELQTQMQEFTTEQLQPMQQRLEVLEKNLQGSHPTDPIAATTPQPLQLSQMPNVPSIAHLPLAKLCLFRETTIFSRFQPHSYTSRQSHMFPEHEIVFLSVLQNPQEHGVTSCSRDTHPCPWEHTQCVSEYMPGVSRGNIYVCLQ